MELSAVFRSLGQAAVDELVRTISLGTLKAYQLYDGFKVRARLTKLNAEHLRKATPRLWERLEQGDEDLAGDLAQAILVSNTNFVVEALDFLQIQHDGAGFLQKDAALEQQLTEGWQQRVLEQFRGRYPETLIRLYVNHLTWEANKQAELFAG